MPSQLRPAASVKVNGVRSTYSQQGPTEDTVALVFIHGNPGDHGDFEALMSRLPDHVRAVALDMPGFGAADRPRHFDFTLPGYVQHLAGCLRALNLRRVHLVGHDLGGLFALGWSAQRGAQDASLASLCLVNSGILRGFHWHAMARLWQTPVLAEIAMAGLTRGVFGMLMNAKNPKPFPRSFLDRVYCGIDAGNKRAVRALYRSMPDAASMFEGLARGARGWDVPTLVVWGAEDRYLPAHHAAEQTAFFPNARIKLIEGCGHWPFVDDLDAVASHMQHFWTDMGLGA